MEDAEYAALPPGDQWGKRTHHAGQDGKQRERKSLQKRTQHQPATHLSLTTGSNRVSLRSGSKKTTE